VYDTLIATIEVPLDSKAMVTAFHLWDEEIGAAKLK